MRAITGSSAQYAAANGKNPAARIIVARSSGLYRACRSPASIARPICSDGSCPVSRASTRQLSSAATIAREQIT